MNLGMTGRRQQDGKQGGYTEWETGKSHMAEYRLTKTC